MDIPSTELSVRELVDSVLKAEDVFTDCENFEKLFAILEVETHFHVVQRCFSTKTAQRRYYLAQLPLALEAARKAGIYTKRIHIAVNATGNDG